MTNPTLTQLVRARLSRREALGIMGIMGASGLFGCASLGKAPTPSQSGFGDNFKPVSHGIDDQLHVPDGYSAQVLIGWGDALADGSSYPGDLGRIPAADQAQRFGANSDFTAYIPLPASGADERGLLCVNHEITMARLMFPGMPPGRKDSRDLLSKAQLETELAAHGHSVIEIVRRGDLWKVVDSPRTRRFSALETIFEMSGPAAGHPRLKTSADPSGSRVVGTLANCSGGITPWGTVLIAEENFENYFGGKPKDGPEKDNLQRSDIAGDPDFGFWRFFDRFDVSKEPCEPNRFGWMVEYDPKNPNCQPKKRTALGRFSHEGAACTVDEQGRAVLYMADDSSFEYLYRFVSKGLASAGGELLDDGELAVARFEADGQINWLPLVHGQGPLVARNGFGDQGDVLIDVRKAADLLGATPMDRPEGIEVHPDTGRVYVALTYNSRRKPEQADAVHSRTGDLHGQILEISPPSPEARSASTMSWNVLLAAGDPSRHSGTKYGPGLTDTGWLANPDNLRFDPKGRLWICTDGAEFHADSCDGIWLCPVMGDARAVPQRFLRVPTGAECTGPSFSPDGQTLFVSIQHPGGHYRSTLDRPTSRWPDRRPDRPPRACVVAIRRQTD